MSTMFILLYSFSPPLYSSENQKNVSTKSAFSTSVDKVVNVIPITHYTSVVIANMLTTAYPPLPVDKGTVVLKTNLW